MTVIDDYLLTLTGKERQIITHMCAVVRETTPDATEEMSYAMPAFKYKGKGLISIISNKKFMSIYPFETVATLGLDLSAYECTSGSIHFASDKPVSDELLKDIVNARKRQIES
jgi:uncharacterized protein YdhG (YjbR/CyaY superfamily)